MLKTKQDLSIPFWPRCNAFRDSQIKFLSGIITDNKRYDLYQHLPSINKINKPYILYKNTASYRICWTNELKQDARKKTLIGLYLEVALILEEEGKEEIIEYDNL